MRDYTTQNKKAYNHLAAVYTREWADKPDTQLAKLFLQNLNNGARILDVGCGPGHYSHYFYENGYNAEGIDFCENMVKISQSRYKEISFSVQDMRRLSFDDHAFDALWVCASFPHIQKCEALKALLELKRVLKSDGVLFINAIIGEQDCRIEDESEIAGSYKGQGRFFQWYPTSECFRAILAEAGFDACEINKRTVTSQVVQNATVRTNQWSNFICRPIAAR